MISEEDEKFLADMLDKGATVIDATGVYQGATGSWAREWTTLELLAMLDEDFEKLDLGEWEPDGNSIDASRDVVAEIILRVKKLEANS